MSTLNADQAWTWFVRNWREVGREAAWPGYHSGTFHSTWCTCGCDQ